VAWSGVVRYNTDGSISVLYCAVLENNWVLICVVWCAAVWCGYIAVSLLVALLVSGLAHRDVLIVSVENVAL
jgi:hypothetical protein